jgi:hypothetical protein
MSDCTVKLCVWITRLGDACHIDDNYHWYVHITDCHGNVLKWCGRTYSFISAKCGHVEIEVPPGCYTVFASWTPHGAVHPPYQPFGNQLTHVQVVRANCGDRVCVTLFSPSGHYCGTWFAHMLKEYGPLFEQAKIDTNLARAAQTAVKNFVDKLEPDPYTVNVLKLIEQGPPKE